MITNSHFFGTLDRQIDEITQYTIINLFLKLHIAQCTYIRKIALARKLLVRYIYMTINKQNMILIPRMIILLQYLYLYILYCHMVCKTVCNSRFDSRL